MNASPFVMFGNIHLVTIVAVILVSIFFPLSYKNKSENAKAIMNKIIAFIILAHVIISPYKDLYLLQNPYNWVEVIPLHMCDLSAVSYTHLTLPTKRIV